jgi:hypothetical protein
MNAIQDETGQKIKHGTITVFKLEDNYTDRPIATHSIASCD